MLLKALAVKIRSFFLRFLLHIHLEALMGTEDEETANLNVGTKKERVRIIGLSSNPVGLTRLEINSFIT